MIILKNQTIMIPSRFKHLIEGTKAKGSKSFHHGHLKPLTEGICLANFKIDSLTSNTCTAPWLENCVPIEWWGMCTFRELPAPCVLATSRISSQSSCFHAGPGPGSLGTEKFVPFARSPNKMKPTNPNAHTYDNETRNHSYSRRGRGCKV